MNSLASLLIRIPGIFLSNSNFNEWNSLQLKSEFTWGINNIQLNLTERQQIGKLVFSNMTAHNSSKPYIFVYSNF